MTDTPKAPLTDLQALLDAATDGPWEVGAYSDLTTFVSDRSGNIICHISTGIHDARLTAMAPDLAKRVLELEAAIKRQACLASALRKLTLDEVAHIKDSERNASKLVDSERDANAILTDENEALAARVSELEAALREADETLNHVGLEIWDAAEDSTMVMRQALKGGTS